jgi:hypothetical protein
MDRPLAAAVLATGVALGLIAGIAFAVARLAWRDYTTTKASVPGLRKAAWALIRVAFTKGGIVLLLCVAAVGWAALGGKR